MYSSAVGSAGSSETVITIYQNTRLHTPEDDDLNAHRRKKLKSDDLSCVYRHFDEVTDRHKIQNYSATVIIL
jgi:hypothetical protein